MRRMDAVEVRPVLTASSSHQVWPGRRTWVFPYLTPALALYSLFVLWPVVQLFWLALQRWNGYGPRHFVGLANLGALMSDPLFRTSLDHSLLWDAGAVFVVTPLALLLALGIRRTRFQRFFLSVLFFPALLPPAVLAAIAILGYSPLSGPLNEVLRGIGLSFLAADWLGDPHLVLGSLFVVWLWSAIGVGAVILWSALGSIAREYRELALVEGAGTWWRLRHITLPGLRRSMLTVAAIEIVLASQAFDLVFMTTGGGPGYATMLLPLDMYGRAFGGRAGQGAAVACIQILLVLAIILVLFLLFRTSDSLDTGERAAEARDTSPPVTVVLIAATLFFLSPLAWLPLAAIQPGRSFALAGPSLDPGAWTLSNLTSVWNAGLGGAITTSLALALAVVAITLVFCAPAAFALTRLGWARTPILGLLIFGLIQPSTVLVIPLFSLLRQLQVLGTLWGVLLPEVARSIPFATLVIWAYLAGLPREVFE
ncbi:MAG: ABC transporter permease subunit, partial [Chloroflexota bacterium]|nr:ABC transporter permease subunit [Chloroflexota bacterium]